MNNQEQTQQPLTKKQRRELKRQNKLNQKKREESKKTISKIVIWSSLLILVIGGIYLLSQANSGDSSNSTAINIISDYDNVKGNPDGEIVLIEYSDFQCPACYSYYNMVKTLMEEFSDNINFVYRDFPLRNLHKNSQLAAQAAEAAGQQGKFWEMHDKLFENQNKWSEESNPEEKFLAYATELELNIDQFTTDLNSKKIKDKIDNDYASGIAARVNSTPSFFLNGEKINNPRTLDDFRALIQEKIDSSIKANTTN